MRVRVLYFARLRETLGIREEVVELPDGAEVRALLEAVKSHHEALRGFKELLVAVNGEYASVDRRLREGDVVALLPPVSGG